jgi:hypothetical protein
VQTLRVLAPILKKYQKNANSRLKSRNSGLMVIRKEGFAGRGIPTLGLPAAFGAFHYERR